MGRRKLPKYLRRFTRDWQYVAFIDVLGYQTILLGRRIKLPTRRVQYIFDTWDCLVATLGSTAAVFPKVRGVVFSDSAFLSCPDPVELLAAVTNIYAGVYNFYRTSPQRWMPWLRSSVAHGWLLHVRDPSMSARLTPSVELFRNPTGPAVAEAYLLAERAGIAGMRVIVPLDVRRDYLRRVRRRRGLSQAAQSLVPDLAGRWPRIGQLSIGQKRVIALDLPWWRAVSGGGPFDRSTFTDHRWQANLTGTTRSREQFDATLRLFPKVTPSVQHVAGGRTR